MAMVAGRLGIRLLILLLTVAIALGGCLQRELPSNPNILLIVIDTVRADHLSSYGYSRATSPHIDRLAERGTRFDKAHSTAPYTRPSTASILSGFYPSVHGAITHADSISPEIPMLAETLRDAGYQTVGIHRNGNVSEKFGFGRGFDQYSSPDKAFVRERKKAGRRVEFFSETDDSLLTHDAVDQLGRFEEAPFFLYLHLGGAHAPYSPPEDALSFLEAPLTADVSKFYSQPLKYLREEPTVLRQFETGQLVVDATTREQMVALYDAEISFADEQIGLILAALEENDLDESTLVVVTADHGEEFWDHGGLGHGHTQYEEQLHVPLVVAGPAVRKRVVDRPVSLIDLTPTLLDYAGVDPPKPLPGRSWVPTLTRSRRDPESSPVFAEGLLRYQQNDPLFGRSIQIEDQKLILDFQTSRKLRFDLSVDGGEKASLFGGDSLLDRGLWQELIEIHQRNLDSSAALPVEVVDVPESLENDLRALGYLGSTSDSEATTLLFRRPLRLMDNQAFGFLGHELEGSDYASTLVMTDPSAFSAEQLLYGWSGLVDGRPARMAARAGVRLKRSPTHREWRVSVAPMVLDQREEDFDLEVRLDGGEAIHREMSGRGRSVLRGRLPDGNSGWTRIDLECRFSYPEGSTARKDPYAPCLAVWEVTLEESR